MADLIRDDPGMNRRLLEYILSVSSQASGYWGELMRDVKNTPFPGSSNIGIGLESIFGEYLVPVGLQNTVDLEPMCQAEDIGTGQTDDALTKAHDEYLRTVLVVR